MTRLWGLCFVLAAVMTVTSSAGAASHTAQEKALQEGAQQLTSDEIAEHFVGNTATFVSAYGDKKFLVYYGEAIPSLVSWSAGIGPVPAFTA